MPGYTKENAAEKGINAGDSTANYNQIMRAGVQVLKMSNLPLCHPRLMSLHRESS